MTTTAHDSGPDTRAHIARVRQLLEEAASNLLDRSHLHDRSKLLEPEKGAFDRASSLRDMTYGSPEYEASRVSLGDALTHHYAANSHHPEHWPDGIDDMSLLDQIEMLCDWKAATERHADGDLARSLEINRARFGISDQLSSVLRATAVELGFISLEDAA